MKSVIILGAGMVGVSSAIHLQRRGWSVVIIDRNEPGRETSYGNAGIIQSEAVRPYAMPRDIASLASIAAGLTNDVRYRATALPSHVNALIRYWWHSMPARHRAISDAYATLIAQALPTHDGLIQDAGAGALVRREGFFLLHRTAKALEAALAIAAVNRDRYGVRFSALTPAQLRQAEPGLINGGAGAIHWEDPWTVSDPGALVKAYAELFLREGGRILRGDAASLEPDGAGWRIDSADGPLTASAALVALGPWSPILLRRFGYRFTMVRKRGYHRHYAGGAELLRPVMDGAFGYVLAPMRQGLRITTGAELTGADAPATPVQLKKAEAAARTLVKLGNPVEAEPWFGTRPCMPDMLPVIGRAPRHRSLWLNFGHGHQGFTLGPATGRMTAELMDGDKPYVDPTPFRPER
ncbi:FAD-binding oxidoreductase [Bradyrhizobium sp. WD16]|uniref:NAD(P)/FAD-dependent oxidoreductase n=1 Tax=Bradyrhizobium sp. WD16 TaxID=1521768 RepID=UPI0020A31D5F|nr:FAD-binding oxidoreductase [Bradyrhizobium sp. WD16]UTD29467.1 amino acid dehydrogenase [Bradyrhizobium sp. WD16]